MSIVKSFSVGDGDTFYIKHNSDNFTIIDCCLSDENKQSIVEEIKTEKKGVEIVRFISTHPDDDHICGLEYLDKQISIVNFYCVKNEATKEDETDDFDKYCELRDSKEKAFYLYKGCSRKWMNRTDEERGSSGINILWPDENNKFYKEALKKAKEGESPNNISPIIEYSLQDGVRIIWMGDLMEAFMENIKNDISLPKTDILFAPHHGRDKVPEKLLKQMSPKIVIIGEAPSKNLNYYTGYNTITQNSAGDIILDCLSKKVNIYVSDEDYAVDFLDHEADADTTIYNYLGTLKL